MRRRFVGLVVLGLLAAAVGCSGGDDPDDAAPTSTTVAPGDATPPEASALAAADLAQLRDLVGDGTCDELDAAHCLLPFPSDRFTVADDGTDTGRRVDLPGGQLANADGNPLDVAEWNRNDGFSPGSPMMAMLGAVDLDASGAPPQGDIGRSLDDDSATVVVDLTSGERLAHWAELDARAEPGEQVLILRGAAALPEGHRIGVAMRGLVDGDGEAIQPSLAFRAYRDNQETDIDRVEERRAAMESLFEGLAAAGVDRSDLQIAWEFTVASAESIAGPMLAMRDDAFERLGDGAPAFEVAEVVTADLPPGVGRRVRGTFEVPLYLDGDGEPGSSLLRDDDGTPRYAGKELSANFTCQIPEQSLVAGGDRARPVVYGHGLMGSAGESENSQVAKIASTNTMMYCATDWLGMSESDIGNVVAILGDISRFPTLTARGLQGILDALFLARAMRSEDGFGSDPAFQDDAGQSVVDGTDVYYDGNSQGAIMGCAATAVSTEWTKAVLGVGGMNYSLLLDRSVDFDTYFAVLRGAYPDRVDQLVGYGVLQMLWDRAEGNGYAQHLTDDPYPGTPEHQVLMHIGFGDHQVSQWAAEIQARTIGAVVRAPALAAGRHPDAEPFFGLEQSTDLPGDASVFVYWDSGTLAPPHGDITPTMSEAFAEQCGDLSEDEQENSAACADSHEDPRRAPQSIEQKDLFFRPDGRIVDTCDGEPCTAPNRFTLDY